MHCNTATDNCRSEFYTSCHSSIAFCLAKMVSSETYSLKWSEFSHNLTSFFGEQKDNSDFTDVTLACDDQSQTTAHRVLLAASSSFFKEILSKQKNTNLLVYITGVKSRDLNGLLNFIYHGEVNVYQEDLDGFLELADELGCKGLEGFFMKETIEPKESENIAQKTKILEPKKETESTDVETTQTNFDKSSSMVDANVPMTDKELDERIMTMMEKREGIWTCKVCGKTTNRNKKQQIKHHVEGVHMADGAHSCNQCGRIFKSRTALKSHVANYPPGHVFTW